MMIFLETLAPVLLEGIKQAGAVANETSVRLTVEQTTKINWWQYIPSLVLASVGSLYFLYLMFSQNSLFAGRRLLKKIEKLSGRKVILIKHTMHDLFGGSMISWETIREINKRLSKLNGERVLLILHTPGGEIFSTLLLSRILRKYPGGVDIMIPYYAMSGGTLLALSGKELYMNDISCLGVVDPQLGILFGGYGSAKGWNEVVRIKKNKANDQSIIMNLMGKQYTKSIRSYLSELLNEKLHNGNKEKFLDLLTSGAVEHGYNILKSDLQNIGIKIYPIPSNINTILDKIINNKRMEGVR